MKRFIVLLLTLVIGVSYGQKKPKINQAEKERSEGNLGEAKNIIDEAIEHEKTKDDGKTWYYRALVYMSLDTTSNPEYQNLANNPLQIAMEAMAKADELNKGNNNNEYYITNDMGLPITRTQQIAQLYNYYLNSGVEYYQNDEGELAYETIRKTTILKPSDTTGYIYSGQIAQAGQNFEAAAENFYYLVNELNHESQDIFNALIYIESSVNEDDEKALEIIKKARTVFPNEPSFAKSEINALIRLGRAEEAKTELEAAIANEPDNPSLWFTLGVMYEETKNPEKAKEAYKSSLEVDGNYYNSRFNLAVLTYNEAVNLIKEQNNLGISAADQKKSKAMEGDIVTSLKAALPHWEKVNELEPNDRTALETLQYIYSRLKMTDKFNAVSDKLDSMGDDQ